MTQIQSTIRIDTPREKVWDALSDFGGIHKFHPGLKDSFSTSSSNAGVGATRQCDLKPMGVIQERVLEWREGESMEVAIYEGKNMPPLDFSTTRGSFKLRGEGQSTIVTFSLNYETKGVAGAMMAPMLKANFSKTVENVLRGLKFYVEKGKTPETQDLKRIPVLATASERNLNL